MMTTEQVALFRVSGQADQIAAALGELEPMLTALTLAVRAADLYLNNYDTSAPSRVKAETRALVEEAMGLLRPQEGN